MYHKDKYSILKKFVSSYIVVLLLLSSVSMLFMNTTRASGSYENTLKVSPSVFNVTVGDTFYTDLDVIVTWDITNVTVSNIAFNPAGTITYESTTQGNLFGGTVTWLEPEADGTIDNASGWAAPIVWNASNGVNQTTGKLANITWIAQHVGMAMIGLQGTTRNASGVNHTTIVSNGTIIVHPKGPTNFQVSTYNSTQINLTFSHDTGVDNVLIIRKQGSPPSDMMDGTLVYNDTGTSHNDGGLTQNTSYFYLAVGWNATADLYSFGNENLVTDNMTMSDGGQQSGGNASLSGYVLYSSNQTGIPGATVEIYDNSSAYSNLTTTDGSGFYQFTNLSAGTYDLRSYKNEVFQPRWQSSLSVPTNDSHIPNINFTISTGSPGPSGNSTVEGYVKTEGEQQPIKGATVTIELFGGGYQDQTTTDSNGYYNFTNLEAGDYNLEASKQNVFDTVSQPSVTLPENSTVSVNFSVMVNEVTKITCKGYVYQDMTDMVPIEGATVSAVTDDYPFTDIRNFTLTDSEGYFEMSFSPNETAMFEQDIWDIRIIVNKSGYHMMNDETFGVQDQRWDQEQMFWLQKIWTINAFAHGYVYLHNTSTPLDNATVMTMVESNYYYNMTMTDNTGYFTLGLYSEGGADEFEFTIQKQGYFVNMTENVQVNASENKDLGIIYLETRPSQNSYVEGYINCGGQPVPYIELMLFDPEHPFEGEKEDMPRTNATGYYNISTYAGEFYLITMAKMIGERKDGPPLAIGGYNNQVIQIFVGENQTVTQNVTLTQSSQDVFQAAVEFIGWNQTMVNMSRIVKGNAKLLRYMTDIDLDGQISTDEATELADMVNSSLTGNVYQMEAFLLFMPFVLKVDGVTFAATNPHIEIAGLEGPTDSSNPLTIYVNNTLMRATGQISDSFSSHGVNLYGYYGNPAFNTSYTLQVPSGFTVLNAREELMDITGVGTTTVAVIPQYDPDWNDTTFYESVYMYVSNATAPASFNTGYQYNNLVDSDADSLYNFLMRKIKFNTTTAGTFTIEASLRSQSGIIIDEWSDTKSFTVGTGKIVEFSFEGERIYRKGINGVYNVVVDLYLIQSGAEVWLDSMSQNTPSYVHTSFDPPAIFFTGNVTDFGSDTDDDGTYDYFILSLEVDVGDPDDYTVEGNLDIMSYQGGDTWITRVEKTTTFYETGKQLVNLSFDGAEINSKGQNASIWAHVNVRKKQDWQMLDSLDHQTEKYFYSNFVSPPPETCSISGIVTDAHGNTLDAMISLRDELRFSDNSTTTTNGAYQINAKPGTYRLEVWCTNSSSSLNSHDEVVILEENESISRNITLLPPHQQTDWINWMLDDFQYASGDPIYINITSSNLMYSNASLDIYREYELDDKVLGEEYIGSLKNITDATGYHSFLVNTSGLSAGWYMFDMWIANASCSPYTVARGDIWGLQVSSLSLDFTLSKNKYKPSTTGNFTYNLTYVTNGTCVPDASFKWKIVYWDWTEHILASGTFTDQDGHGTKSFTIPSSVETDQWYEVQLEASTDSGSVTSWNSFGVTEGSTISSVTDDPVGSSGSYDALLFNVTVDISQGADYRVECGLQDQNHRFIGWNETHEYLTTGSHVLPVIIPGEAIQSKGYNGPYNAWIGLFQEGAWEELDSLEYTTDSYSATDFATPAIRFMTTSGITIYKFGTQGNYQSLYINLTVNASEPGNYSIQGNLHKRIWYGDWWEGQPVAWNCTDLEIVGGVNNDTNVTVSLRFEGSEIYNSGQLGPYNINLNLNKGTCEQNGEWITFYDPETEINANYTEFSKPAAVVEGIANQDIVDGDLVITLQINVTAGYNGTYRINGMLHSSEADGYMWITDSWNETTLSDGLNLVNIVFSGDEIYSKGYDGSYSLDIELQRTNPTQWLGWKQFSTNYYFYTYFSMPDAMFTGTPTDRGVDTNGDGYYDVLRVQTPVEFNQSGHYEISGELYKEDGWNWQFITWKSVDLPGRTPGTATITIDFSGNEIVNKGLEGYYGVNLWLRNVDIGKDLSNLEFTTSNSYVLSDFGQPSVHFTDGSPTGDYLTPDGKYIAVNLTINATEIGTYYVNGDLHKVINQDGWDNWIWITPGNRELSIMQPGETSFNISFGTAMIASSGYNGPYKINFHLFDNDWEQIDSINDYSTKAYDVSNYGARPVNFSGSFSDYLYPSASPEYVKINVTLTANEAGDYSINADLHKQEDWNWNWIAGDWRDVYLTEGTQNITLQFDSVEILDNIQTLGLSDFTAGTTFDVDIWVRRSGEWSELDHLGTVPSKHTYATSDFSASLGASIDNVQDNGYNEDNNNEATPYDYLNITVTVNFTETGNYELWCDLGKDDGYKWSWIGWQNNYQTISTAQVKNITLQFDGERINSVGMDGPYNLYMELKNLDSGKRMDRYSGQTSSGYSSSDFASSQVGFIDGTSSAVGVDTTDAGSDYDYLLVSVDVNAQQAYSNVELRGDLHKESMTGSWQWISWQNNWTSLSTGNSTVTLRFDGEIIHNSDIDGPYHVRLELWDMDEWKLLDTVERIQTPAYTADNFQAASASFIQGNFGNWGNDTDSDGKYDYLEVNCSVSCLNAGTYEVSGELFSDVGGWYWLGWTNTMASLSEGTQDVTLRFDGITIRNKGVDGRYKARVELRDSNGKTLDSVDPYTTSSYVSTDFQSSGAEFVTGAINDRIKDGGDYLEINVTVTAATNGTYWVGADLHKETGWNWEWIAFEGKEKYLTTTAPKNFTILFSGEAIRNSGIDGPYHLRLELRDTATWSEQDFIERYTTSTYLATDFSEPAVSFDDTNIDDWGNDTDSDSQYNYLEINVSLNCSSAGTYWLNGNLEKRTDYNWQWVTWKGQEVTLTSGLQTVKLQFDGETLNNKNVNGPYTLRLEISNITDWTRLDTVEDYTTQSYTASQFEGASVTFVEANTADYGNDTDGDGQYNYLDINLTINCSEAGTYWLGADLSKTTGYSWQWIAWKGKEITLTADGEQNVKIQFDGSQLRNKGINGPYKVRIELNSVGGTFKQYDVIDDPPHTTASYSYTDFESAGIELVNMADTTEDSIVSGNLQINVTVNSSTTGKYEITGDLSYESGYTWNWIAFKSMKRDVTSTGETTFALTFNGGDIYESDLNGPYNVHIELRDVGTKSLIDSIDKYITSGYFYTQFSPPSVMINETDDYKRGNTLQLNVSIYSASSDTYVISSVLHGSNYEFILWADNSTTVDGEQTVNISFDGSLIANSHVNPAKVYVEMRRLSDWELMDQEEFRLNHTYTYGEFSAGVTIDTGSITSTVWDDPGDSDGYNDSLNVSVNVTFTTAGNYKISSGLRDATGVMIAGSDLGLQSYGSGTETINLSFDGLKIYMRNRNGPYTVSFISIAKEDGMEIARAKNAHTTSAYAYTIFEHPEGTVEEATLAGSYSSYTWDRNDDGSYDYLVVNVSVLANTTSSDYDVYGDLFYHDSTSGSWTWIAADKNDSLSLTAGQTTAVKLYFEGDDVYSSLTDGPYVLGYVRVGALIGNATQSWVLLDEATNVHTTKSYSYEDFTSSIVAPLTTVTEVNVSNNPFSPNSDGSYDNTLVTVTGVGGQSLYVNIYNSTSILKRTGLALTEITSDTYTVTWHGKDDNDTILPDGSYTLKISNESTGNQANESLDAAGSVVIDTASPTVCSVEINSNDPYTNVTAVNLTTITATDNSAVKMRFKNAAGNWTSWQDFSGSRAWTLSSGDGIKTVYYEAKDVANNTIASPVSDTITLDTTKPSVNMTITGKGDATTTHTNNVSVTLSITGTDATSGVEYMKISNSIAFTGASWTAYNTSKAWTLNSGDGVKTVYIKVKDRAGKISDISSDNITLDTTAPTGLTIAVESNQPYINTTSVTLTLSASNATKMQASNYANFTGAAWESYATSKNWSLIDGNGTRKVYFRAKDTAGNIATAKNDSIILDKKAPAISSVQSSGVSQSSATITWSTDESSTSKVDYGTTTSYGSNTTLNTTKVMSHSQTISGLSSGTTYHYRVRSKDSAGNQKVSSDYTFTTSSGGDTTPPDAITGLTVTDKINAEKTLSLSWNQSDAPDFAGYRVYRKANASFTNVSQSGVQLIKTITTRSTTTYDDTSAVDDYTYYYAVVAYDTATPANVNRTVSSVSGVSIDDKAPVTTDNFVSSWYTSEKTVILTATDSGKGIAATQYKIYPYGGNASSYNYSTYTMPFTVGGDNTNGDGRWNISYYSYDLNTTANEESLHNETLKVDSTDPSTTDDAPSTWQNTSVSVTLNATDATSGVSATYYTKDGSVPTVASSQYSTAILFSTDGNRTLKYFTKDIAGNSESVKTSYILLDATPPTSSIQSLSTYKTLPFNLTWTSSDTTSGVCTVTIQVKNGTGSWTTWMSALNSAGTASFSDGAVGYTYYFRSIALDNASNTESAGDADASTTVLSSALTVEITAPSDDDGDGYIYARGNLAINGSASGANFTSYYLNYSSDGSNWTTIATAGSPVNHDTLGTLNTSALTDGNYTILLTAFNETANNSVNITITVDNTAPAITAGPSSSVTTTSATITWTTNESTTTHVDYGSTSSYGSSVTTSGYATSHSKTVTGLSAGTTYHYRVVSYDKAGNGVLSSDTTFTTTSDETPSEPPPSTPAPDLEPDLETENETEEVEEEVDNLPVISSFSHSPTSPKSTNTVTISATVTDDSAVTAVHLYWNDGSDHSKSMTLSKGNTYQATIGPFTRGKTVIYSVDAVDDASQTTQSSTKSFTISQGPTVEVIGNVTTGEENDIDLQDDDDTGVEGVEFTASKDLTNVQISIEKLSEKPVDVPDTPTPTEDHVVYTYLEIALTANNASLEEGDIASLTIKFKVEQAWLSDNNIDKESVILVRRTSGEWQQLPTTYLREDEIYCYYQALTPGTSTFAVIASRIIDIPETPTGEPFPWIFIIVGVVAAIILVIAFLFKTGFFYLEDKEIEQQEKKKWENKE